MNPLIQFLNSFSILIQKFNKVLSYPTRVNHNLFEIIELIGNQQAQIHDIKLKFGSEVHGRLKEIGHNIHPHNKGIGLTYIPRDDKRFTIKAQIYPKTVQVDVACTNNPISYDVPSLLYLKKLLTEFSMYLFDISGMQTPPAGDWIITHYHLNKDGEIEINGDRFNITINNLTGGLIRFYSKVMPDGTCHGRIEQIKTPNITLTEALQRAMA